MSKYPAFKGDWKFKVMGYLAYTFPRLFWKAYIRKGRNE